MEIKHILDKLTLDDEPFGSVLPPHHGVDRSKIGVQE
jgi:hypothetical protein